ncbi:hypothetical protein, partial [Limnospira sp. PMC 1042.18]|uniref:hypothetical protein n=1 Tax=Limnospira sp. PMC 1042.18 TaxID=2981018 RepID=UPI0028E0BE90
VNSRTSQLPNCRTFPQLPTPTCQLSDFPQLPPANSRTSPNTHPSTHGLPPTLTRQLSDLSTLGLTPPPTSDL